MTATTEDPRTDRDAVRGHDLSPPPWIREVGVALVGVAVGLVFVLLVLA